MMANVFLIFHYNRRVIVEKTMKNVNDLEIANLLTLPEPCDKIRKFAIVGVQRGAEAFNTWR